MEISTTPRFRGRVLSGLAVAEQVDMQCWFNYKDPGGGSHGIDLTNVASIKSTGQVDYAVLTFFQPPGAALVVWVPKETVPKLRRSLARFRAGEAITVEWFQLTYSHTEHASHTAVRHSVPIYGVSPMDSKLRFEEMCRAHGKPVYVYGVARVGHPFTWLPPENVTKVPLKRKSRRSKI